MTRSNESKQPSPKTPSKGSFVAKQYFPHPVAVLQIRLFFVFKLTIALYFILRRHALHCAL